MDFIYEEIKCEVLENNILSVQLISPKRINALSFKSTDELMDLWKKLKHDSPIRVVILGGEGDKGFCGGADIKENHPQDAAAFYDWQSKMGELLLAMRVIPQPIICMAHGLTIGGGFSLAMASDIRLITKDIRFSAFYINVGVGGADMGSSYFLPRQIGTGRAYEYLLTGDFMYAQDALELGFVSRCVDTKEQLMDVAIETANTIANKDPLAVRLTKEAINIALDCPGLLAALEMENRNQSLMAIKNIADGKPRPFAF